MGRRTGRMTKSSYESFDVEVTIDIDDVCEYVRDHAGPGEIKAIQSEIRGTYDELPPTNRTLVDDMKTQLLIKAHQAYTLEELEERLGMTYI